MIRRPISLLVSRTKKHILSVSRNFSIQLGEEAHAEKSQRQVRDHREEIHQAHGETDVKDKENEREEAESKEHEREDTRSKEHEREELIKKNARLEGILQAREEADKERKEREETQRKEREKTQELIKKNARLEGILQAREEADKERKDREETQRKEREREETLRKEREETQRKEREEAERKNARIKKILANFGSLAAFFGVLITLLFYMGIFDILIFWKNVRDNFIASAILPAAKRRHLVHTSLVDELAESISPTSSRYFLVYGHKAIGKTTAISLFADALREKGYPVMYMSFNSDTSNPKDDLLIRLGRTDKKTSTLSSLLDQNIESATMFTTVKHPVLIFDNINVLAKSTEGRKLLSHLQSHAKTNADSLRATFIFVTSEGAALPLLIGHTDAGRMSSLQLHEMSDIDSKKVLKKHIQKEGYLPTISDELLDTIVAVTGGNMESTMELVKNTKSTSDITSILLGIVQGWENKLSRELKKIKFESVETKKRFLKLVDEVNKEAASNPGTNVHIPCDRALSILSDLKEEKIQPHTDDRDYWMDELEKVFATDVLGRVNSGDVGLQYRGHRFAWARILKKKPGESNSDLDGEELGELLSHVKELISDE